MGLFLIHHIGEPSAMHNTATHQAPKVGLEREEKKKIQLKKTHSLPAKLNNVLLNTKP